MSFKNINREVKRTKSRKLKKRESKLTSVFSLNSNIYSISIKYSLLKYFFIKQYIYLNRTIVNQLFKEELGFIFSLNT